MPLTPEQVAELQATQSHYGCGADSCAACYPIQYRCEYCFEDFDNPIRHKEVFECTACGWVNNEETQW